MEPSRSRREYAEVRDELAALERSHLETMLHEVVAEERCASGRKAAVLAELVKRNAHTRDGCRTTHDFVAYRTRCSPGQAAQLAAVIDQADDIPEALNQLVRGTLSLEKAALCASIVTDENRDNARACESDRVDIIRGKQFARAQTYARRQRHRLTPADARLPTAERQRHDRGVRIVRHRDGMATAMVTLDPENINRIENLLADKEAELARIDRQNRELDHEAGLDRRTSKQRKADALLSILNAGANATASQPIAEIAVVLRETTHGKLEAAFSDGSPLHQSTVERLGCSSRILRMVIDADDRVINLGTTSRIPTRAQRRALLVRDGGCRFGACAAPPHELHAHHIQHVESGGDTSLENVVMLCEQHHRLVHEGGFTLARLPDGQLEFRRPDGTLHSRQPYCAFTDDELPLTG